jgi:hypothetical protein
MKNIGTSYPPSPPTTGWQVWYCYAAKMPGSQVCTSSPFSRLVQFKGVNCKTHNIRALEFVDLDVEIIFLTLEVMLKITNALRKAYECSKLYITLNNYCAKPICAKSIKLYTKV